MIPDDYWPTPRGTFEERRRQYLAYCVAESQQKRTGFGSRLAFFSQIARLELDLPVDETPIREGIAYVDSRDDCCDFAAAGLLRMLYLYDTSPHLAPDLTAEIERCLLDFKYWWDEPRGDNHRCYHTENHQIIFHADELLAGQRFRDRTFSNSGKDGIYHIDHALHLIRRWFDFRVRFGYSEWLSNCYFEEDLLALVNLHDFAEDAEVRRQAKLQIDVLLYEMALHTYRGVFGSTHGRSYPRFILGARGEGSASTAKLMFGMGLFNHASLGTVPLATSTYRCPQILADIAADLDAPMLFREQHSLNMEDVPGCGLAYDSLEDGHLYWSVQDYTHPTIYDLAQETRRLREIMLYEDYQARYDQVLNWQEQEFGEVVDRDIDCHAMTEVHIQTYRTPDYLLSCAQDYRPAKPGYQQHIWQATLGIDAVVFTNHPGSDDEMSRPNYWAGNGILPRAVQHENVLICLYHLPPDDAFPFSHAYFPRAAFDEVVERGAWVIARKDAGYLALYARGLDGVRWIDDRELRAEGADTLWVVEMGRQADWGSFEAFVEAIASSEIGCEGPAVRYVSPSQGEVRFGRRDPLVIAGEEVPLRVPWRYDNPYCRYAVPESSTPPPCAIRRGDDELVLDFAPRW